MKKKLLIILSIVAGIVVIYFGVNYGIKKHKENLVIEYLLDYFPKENIEILEISDVDSVYDMYWDEWRSHRIDKRYNWQIEHYDERANRYYNYWKLYGYNSDKKNYYDNKFTRDSLRAEKHVEDSIAEAQKKYNEKHNIYMTSGIKAKIRISVPELNIVNTFSAIFIYNEKKTSVIHTLNEFGYDVLLIGKDFEKWGIDRKYANY